MPARGLQAFGYMDVAERVPYGEKFLRAAPRILVVEDDEDARSALSELLAAYGYDVSVASNGQEALEEVERTPPELVISDVCMPKADGYRMVEQLRRASSARHVPVILVSARRETERRVIGLDLGADDYVTKPIDADELLARVRAQLRRAQRQKELLRRTVVDELTGVLNRRGIVDVLRREFKRADRLSEPLSILLVDVDDFKDINDSHGHATGDRVLQHIAAALTEQLRGSDQIGRLGGDEFVIVLPHSGAEAAEALAGRIRTIESLDDDLEIDIDTALRLSVGIATCSPASRSHDCDSLLHEADRSMYRDKRTAKSRNGIARGR